MLTPGWIVSLSYLRKFGAKVSPRAEVDLSENVSMGKGCVVGSFTKLKASDGSVKMGDRCGIATNCFIAGGPEGIEIGDNFVCGPNVVITASNYVHAEIGVHLEDQGITSKGVRIGNNVWIGAGSIILDGSVLGDNCIVVAGSLVNRRYPANSIIQGNPAKIMMKRA
jgi:acetyltransferase-like isoleucine patch superfamily enzyme